MSLPLASDSADLRRFACAVMIAVAVGLAVGRIFSAERVYEPTLHRAPRGANEPPAPRLAKHPAEPYPTFSSNDRSRWAAVRALVDEGTFVVGRRDSGVMRASAPAALAAGDPLQLAVLLQAGYLARVGSDRGIVFEDGWQTVDKVMNPATLEYYSTKPPLLTVLVAGEYWLLKKLFGWSIVEDRWNVIRFLLLTINVVPLLVYLLLLARLVERFGHTEVGRLYVLAAACFGTMMTPFLITFNNHTVATCSAAVALYLALDRQGGWWASAGAGFFAGLTACNELPAAALAVGLFAFALWRGPRQALLAFAPAALVPVAAMLWANYVQLGRLGFAYAEFGGPWYTYEGSHWRVAPGQVKRGIDWAGRNGERNWVYAFHLLIGHHGVFSLMPVMLLAVAGMGVGARRLWSSTAKPQAALGARRLRLGGASPDLGPLLASFTLLVSLVVIGFYLHKSDNYGGWTNGPRWLMWLTPLWLLTMLPVVDWLGQRRWGRALCLVLLGLSVLAMSYQLWNPWRHPWLYTWMEARGWVRY